MMTGGKPHRPTAYAYTSSRLGKEAYKNLITIGS